ncbi:hypothetical protein [Leuconostoc mesenteroides]|uniref:hypothetical protein n=1 Tax=Leuconostoc mesenteroides TaxID=1245 RepID=UPI0023628D31|nr:hypothetical protein [Leuconostoc mesenteroides]
MNENAKLGQHDWFDYISLLVSISIQLIILYVQRFIDKLSKEKEMQPRLALGPFESTNQRFHVGDFYNTHLSLKSNPLQKSQIQIPLYNIGGSPVYNIVVKFTIKDFEKLLVNKPQNALQESDVDQIYLHQGTSERKPEYTLLNKTSDSNVLKFSLIKNGLNTTDEVRGYKHSSFNAKSSGQILVPPLISNEKQSIPMDANFELFVQFILFMNNIRLVDSQPEIPDIAFDINYTDYKDNRNHIKLMMSLVAGKFHEEIDQKSTKINLSWSLQPRNTI